MILGQYSIAELVDLLAAKDYLLNQTETAYNTWLAANPGSSPDASFASDWQAMKDRYAAARSKAQTAIDLAKLNVFVSNTLMPAQAEYVAVLQSMTKSATGDGGTTWGPGDIVDLENRLGNAGVKVDTSQMPQPKKGSDADLSTYQVADTTIKTGEQAAQQVEKAAKSALTIVPWYAWAGGATVLLIGVRIATK
jgi:hypothetical protein